MNEKATTEFEIEVSGGRIIGENLPLKDGRYNVVVKRVLPKCTRALTTEKNDVFVKVEASKLSLDDYFMQYEPNAKAERIFKEQVIEVIKRGILDFYRPVCDPSFDDDGRICYEPGERPAVGKSYSWWKKNAKDFCPERGSRLGTKHEYIAFLAVLIKELVASGKSIEWAWYDVCNDSRVLGHYHNSSNARYDFEDTGSRENCGWCDLANTYKILSNDEENGGYWIAGGWYRINGNYAPLANLHHFDDCCVAPFAGCCGWLVFEE